MGRRPLLILADTNVWLDLYIPNRPSAAASKELVRLACRRGDSLLYPIHAPGNVFFMINAENKRWVRQSKGELSEDYALAIRNLAWDCVDNMQEIAVAVGADMSDVWLACKYRNLHPDFEDDLVLAAAERAKVDFLVTSDKALLRAATVAALTPEDMLTVLKARSD